MPGHLSTENLENLLQSRSISDLEVEQIRRFFIEEEGIAAFAPDGFCHIDPRNGDRIVYNSARARRPHDNRPIDQEERPITPQRDCLICQGRTTHVLDIAPLSEGFTFINKNLYPIFYPMEEGGRFVENTQENTKNSQCTQVHGYHFLQWTSSYHDRDWHNMPCEDRVIVLQRLAALEKKMLTNGDSHVSIIKNYGHLVGGSLAHGHQQIGVSNIIPNRIRQDKKFKEEKDETFSSYMLRENPPELLIRDYGPAVLITPYFMRRPYDMTLILKDTSKSTLHSLNEDELIAVGDGWRDGIRIMLSIMPRIGKEAAYNITTHNGPGAGLYFEFLPYTQEMGGFEHLGLYLCQGNPPECAQRSREILDEFKA